MGLIVRVWRKRRKKFSVEQWKYLGLVLDFFFPVENGNFLMLLRIEFFLPHISASLQL